MTNPNRLPNILKVKYLTRLPLEDSQWSRWHPNGLLLFTTNSRTIGLAPMPTSEKHSFNNLSYFHLYIIVIWRFCRILFIIYFCRPSAPPLSNYNSKAFTFLYTFLYTVVIRGFEDFEVYCLSYMFAAHPPLLWAIIAQRPLSFHINWMLKPLLKLISIGLKSFRVRYIVVRLTD